MAIVTGIIDQSVQHLIDFNHVEDAIPDDVYITYACTLKNDEPDDYWELNGKAMYNIQLNYDQVKNMTLEAVREWMVQLARERISASSGK